MFPLMTSGHDWKSLNPAFSCRPGKVQRGEGSQEHTAIVRKAGPG